jgi:hypothetical protein
MKRNLMWEFLNLTRKSSYVGQELLTLPEHMSSLPFCLFLILFFCCIFLFFVCSLFVLCLCFCFCLPFWLPFWYLQTFHILLQRMTVGWYFTTFCIFRVNWNILNCGHGMLVTHTPQKEAVLYITIYETNELFFVL